MEAIQQSIIKSEAGKPAKEAPSDFMTASKEALLSTCRATKEALEVAIWRHYEAAMTYYHSGAWKGEYPSWEAVCKAHGRDNPFGNPVSLYSASYYRVLGSSLPIALIVESVAGETMLPSQAKTLLGKLNEVVPEGEREKPMFLSMLALAYAYDATSLIPDKNVLDEAYQILVEERDNETITTASGETYSYKNEAQVARIKERVRQDIEAHSTRVTIEIAETRHIGLFLRFLGRLGYNIPKDSKKKLLLSWSE